MSAAQIALAILSGVLIAAAATMFISNDNAQGWIFATFGLLGYLCLLGMIISDAAPAGRRLPPPRP